MPIDAQRLRIALGQSLAEYSADPATAVRSGRFIQPIHAWCAHELEERGLPGMSLVPNSQAGGYIRPSTLDALNQVRTRIRSRLRGGNHAELRDWLLNDVNQLADSLRRSRVSVLGGYLAKQMDVSLVVEDTGPLLAISVKSQMSSISKNAINRFEEYVGDSTNLHTRHPMLVLGFLLLLPVCGETLEPDRHQPTELLRRIAYLLERATGRDEPTGALGSYEASTLMLIDFTKTPPELSTDFPAPESPLRVESFFDTLVELYVRRNRGLVAK